MAPTSIREILELSSECRVRADVFSYSHDPVSTPCTCVTQGEVISLLVGSRKTMIETGRIAALLKTTTSSLLIVCPGRRPVKVTPLSPVTYGEGLNVDREYRHQQSRRYRVVASWRFGNSHHRPLRVVRTPDGNMTAEHDKIGGIFRIVVLQVFTIIRL